jgi:hypothetical protein
MIVSWICNNSLPKENANSAAEAKQSILYFQLEKNMCGNTYFGTKIHHIEAGYYITTSDKMWS